MFIFEKFMSANDYYLEDDELSFDYEEDSANQADIADFELDINKSSNRKKQSRGKHVKTQDRIFELKEQRRMKKELDYYDDWD